MRGNFWAQPVQLAGMRSDSFCSWSFVQRSKSERGRDMEKADTGRTQQGNPVAPTMTQKASNQF